MPLPDGAPRIFLSVIDAAQPQGEDPMARFTDRLEAFEFSDHESKRDEATIALRNEDFALLDDPVFRKGQKILCAWGWPGAMGVPRRMIVTEVRGGNPLIVKAHDTSLLLDRVKRSQVWEDATDSEVATAIARAHGYEGTLLFCEETAARWPSVVQPGNLTDAGMLTRLARRNGFIWFIDATGLHWHRRPAEDAPTHTFIYRNDPGIGTILDEPRIEANLSKGVATVRVLARDPKTKQFVEAVVSGKTADLVSLGQADEMGDEDGADDPVSDRITRTEQIHGGYLAQAAAEALAQARFRETAAGRYKLTLRVVGDATIAAKQIVDVYGISATTDGLYYTKEVVHRIGRDGYTVELQCQKDAQREVDAAARYRAKVNAYARQAQPRTEAQARELRKTLEVRMGPNDEVIPTWVYLDTNSNPVGRYQDLSEAEVFALSERELAFLTRVGAQSQLPDA
jgi:phage protein D